MIVKYSTAEAKQEQQQEQSAVFWQDLNFILTDLSGVTKEGCKIPFSPAIDSLRGNVGGSAVAVGDMLICAEKDVSNSGR